MRIPSCARAAGVLGTAVLGTAALAACTAIPQPGAVSPGDLRPSLDAKAQLFHSGRRILAELPATVPAPQAETLLQPPPGPQVAPRFTPDTWNGQAGLYQGYAPGLTADVLARSRFYPQGDWLFPYYNQGGQYAPISYLHQTTGMHLYPAYLAHQGLQYPVYCSDTSSLVQGALTWPTTAPLGYQSPLTLPAFGAGIPPVAAPVTVPQAPLPAIAPPPIAPPIAPPVILPPPQPCCLPPLPPPPCCGHLGPGPGPVMASPFGDIVEFDYGRTIKHKYKHKHKKWRKRHKHFYDD